VAEREPQQEDEEHEEHEEHVGGGGMDGVRGWDNEGGGVEVVTVSVSPCTTTGSPPASPATHAPQVIFLSGLLRLSCAQEERRGLRCAPASTAACVSASAASTSCCFAASIAAIAESRSINLAPRLLPATRILVKRGGSGDGVGETG
jgi:hypothetical protein